MLVQGVQDGLVTFQRASTVAFFLPHEAFIYHRNDEENVWYVPKLKPL